MSSVLLPGAPRLGFGCGDLYGGAAQAASARLVEAALEAGIRYFDVARLYGDGSAEAALGDALARRRDQVIIASKAGILPWSMLLGTRIAFKAAKMTRSLGGPLGRALAPEPPPAAARHGAFEIGDLTRSVHRSLKALRTDYLDILLLHECGLPDARRPEILGFLERLRGEGKIRSFGVATHFPDTLTILRDAPAIAPVVQFASDALNRNVARLPGGPFELVATHTPIKAALPFLVNGLAADPVARHRWAERAGMAADDRSGIAGLLLAEAVAENADGIVLFSSSRPERVAAAVAAVGRNAASLGVLREELDRLRGQARAAPQNSA